MPTVLPRVALLVLVSFAALAADKPVIKYQAPASDADDRPIATAITIGPQGSDFALRVEFNKTPWGEECKSRCASVTLFVDTDDNPKTGMRLSEGALENGADLAIVIQGVRDYQDESARVFLRVKAIQFGDGAKGVDSGDVIADLDNRHDTERVQSDGNTVYALVDATNATLPSSKSIRVVYHPAGAKALQGKARGMMSTGGGKVDIFRKGKLEGGAKKTKG